MEGALLRVEESYDTAQTVLKNCQIQEIDNVVAEIYSRVDSYAKKGLFRCQIDMTSDDFLNSFSNYNIQDLILENDDFAGMVVQKIRDDGYDIYLMNFGKPKLLKINWDVPKKEKSKEKKKKWFWQKGWLK